MGDYIRRHLLPTLNLDLRQQGLEVGQIGVVEFGGEGDGGFEGSGGVKVAELEVKSGNITTRCNFAPRRTYLV